MIAFDQTVPNACLSDDGDPRLAESREVSINSADADLEMRGNILCPDDSPAL
jgi:hypothetical protein